MADRMPVTTLARYSDRDTAIQEKQESDKQARVAALGDDAKSTAFKAGVYRENYTINAVGDLVLYGWSTMNKPNFPEPPTEFTPDPNYKFDEDEANFGYNPHLMINAESEAEALSMRLQIDQENAQMQIISDSASGTWGTVFGAVVQPHVLLSMGLGGAGLATKLPKVIQSVPGMVATEIALESASEAFLHQQQLTRTKQETALNIVFTGVATGILGSAVKYATRTPKPSDGKLIDDINAGNLKMNEGAYSEGDSAGAMKVGDDISMEEDRLVGLDAKIIPTYTPKGGFEMKTAQDVFSIGQVANLTTSPSKAARWVAQKLGNNSLFTKAHAAGKTHGVTVEAFNDAAMGKTVIATEKAVPMRKASGLEPDKFEHEVGVAMSNGDRHANPKVQEAAEMYRAEVVTPIREAAERVGLLEGADQINIKIDELETQIQEIITSGNAGPGSKVARSTIEAEVGKIEAAADKTTVKLQKKVDGLQVKLDKARTPAKDGSKRTAGKELITQHNEARKLLTTHRKATKAETKAHRERLGEMKKQDAALKAARKEKRDLNKKLATGGTSFAESYFPRIYNKQKIYDNWQRLSNLIRDNFLADEKMLAKYEKGEIEDMVQDTMNNMLMGRYQNMTVKGDPSPTRARSLSLMDNVLEDFLEKNASEAMLRYTQAMQPHIMFREVFENRSLSELFDDIGAEYKVLRADENLTPKKRDKLDKKQKRDEADLQIMYDRLTNQVQRSVRPLSAIEKVVQSSKVLNTAAMLGEIVLTSIPDLARPISHYGLRSFSKGVSVMVKQFMEGAGNMHSIQAKRLGAALQRTLNSRAAQFADTLEPQGQMTQKVQKAWSKYSLFDHYTDVMESVAAHAAMDYTLRAAKKVSSKTPLSKAETKQIARMGLDKDDLLSIWEESMGTMGAKEKDLMYMNTMAWKDMGLAQRVEAGIGSDIKRTIIQSGIGDKPAFMDETAWSWLFQFQTFAMQSQNKVVLAGLQNINRHTAEGFAVMLALGGTVGAIKAEMRGKDTSEWSVGTFLLEGVERSGMVGAMQYPLSVLRNYLATEGILDEAPSRFLQREGKSQFIAPGVSMVDNVQKGLGALTDGDYGKGADYLARTIPLNNLWGIRNTLMTMGDM